MTNAIEIESLSKTYENGHVALKGIDLQVAEGDFFGLLGRNGAGKSTTIGIISSLVNKSSGTVRIFGVDIDENFPLAKSYIGIVPQEINFNVFEYPEQVVTNQAGYYGIPRKLASERALHYLDQLGLADKARAQARELSGGMKRRLMIARALVNEPKLLILDEPTAGVDIEIRRAMWEFLEKINRDGTTIVLTTHYLEEAESLCRNIAIIEDGEIVQNTDTKTLLSQLQQETYVLDLIENLESLPAALASCEEPQWSLRNASTLEVTIPRDAGIDAIFSELRKHEIGVRSMRNKSNRLEQLFLELTRGTLSGADEPQSSTGNVSGLPFLPSSTRR